MTSVNVVYYDVMENGEVLFTERHHVFCNKDWSKLFDFYYERKQSGTLKGLEIVAYGDDENEAPWRDDPIPLAIALNGGYFQSELVKYLEAKVYVETQNPKIL